MEHFINLQNLEELNLSYVPFLNAGKLGELKQLRVLALAGDDINDFCFLEKLRNLEELIVDVSSQADLECIAGSKLKKLHIVVSEGFSNSVNSLEFIRGMSQLESLTLDGLGVEDIGPLSVLRNLKSLSIVNSPVHDLSPLSELTNLHTLTLNSVLVMDLSPLRSLQLLKKLTITSRLFGRYPTFGHNIADITPLGELLSLEELTLGDFKLVRDFSPLARLVNLKKLHITESSIVDLRVLNTLTELRELVACSTPETPVPNLPNLRKIRVIRLDVRNGPHL